MQSSGLPDIEWLPITVSKPTLYVAVGYIDINNSPDIVTGNQKSLDVILNPATDASEQRTITINATNGNLLLSDIDGDTRPEIIFGTPQNIYAFNEALNLENNFPIEVPNLFNKGQSFSSQILTADVDNDGILDIVSVLNEVGVVVFNSKGNLISGFPLSFPHVYYNTSTLFNHNNQLIISGISYDRNQYTAIQLGRGAISEYAWFTTGGNARRNNYLPLLPKAGEIDSNGLLDQKKTFNWPNPVKESITAIRYFPNRKCNISIDIYDLAGDFITSFKDSDPLINDYNEIEWNVSSIESGVYFAVVKATAGSKTDSKIVKIMVIK